jgi:branched-chain amino acid transport system permease protein
LVLLAALPQFANRYAVSLASAHPVPRDPGHCLGDVLGTNALCLAGNGGVLRHRRLCDGRPGDERSLAAGCVDRRHRGFAVAIVVGLSTLRLSGVYFVIFTFGLSELIRQLATWFQINVIKTRVSYIFIKLGDNELYYYLLGLCGVLLLTCAIVQRSRLGFALRVIGEDETVANHAGINTTWAKVSMFAVSSVFMSMTGAIMAPRWTYIDPNIAFNPLVSFQAVIMALRGGIGPLYGPALGAIPLVLLSEYLAGRFPYHFSIALGVCFVVIVYLLPHGLAGFGERLAAHWPVRSHGRTVDQ